MARLDPHSYFDADQPRTRRLTIALDVDFTRQVLAGTVVLDLGGSAQGATIALWGLAFKAQTDDMRESSALTFVAATCVTKTDCTMLVLVMFVTLVQLAGDRFVQPSTKPFRPTGTFRAFCRSRPKK